MLILLLLVGWLVSSDRQHSPASLTLDWTGTESNSVHYAIESVGLETCLLTTDEIEALTGAVEDDGDCLREDSPDCSDGSYCSVVASNDLDGLA